MQFGDLPTGGYPWRPADISHGAFASEFGCIAQVRTDSKIYSHFHYNPRSTPVANANRCEAWIYQRDPLLYKWASSKDHNHPRGAQDLEQIMQRRGDEEGHDIAEHKTDGHTHTYWHGHSHHHEDKSITTTIDARSRFVADFPEATFVRPAVLRGRANMETGAAV